MLASLDQVPEPIDLLDVFRYVEDRCLKVEHARLLGRSRRDG
jgi:predicted CoA-binding protein